MKSRLMHFNRFVLIVGLSVCVTGCWSSSKASQGEKPTPIQVSHPVEREVTDYSDLTGRTAAIDSVEVRARVWGYIDKVNFKEGKLVDKGDVLFEIDPRSYKAALVQSEGNLASAKAKADRLDSDFKRAQSLLDSKSVSREEYERILGDRAEARASISAL